MKHISLTVVAVISSVVMIGTALAFTEPTGAPPLNNAPAPLNVGAGRQTKNGDITLQNIKASSITLGESTRTSWLDAASACKWEGWKCDCRSDGSSGASIALTIGMQCSGGQLQDMEVVDLQISSKQKSCAVTAPAPCKQALYIYKNPAGDAGETTLDKVRNITTKIICLGGLFC